MKDQNLFLTQSVSDLPNEHNFMGIDLIKFVCAFLVCIIHIDPFYIGASSTEYLFSANFWLQQCICRVAVPFYFVTSGFLLFRKLELKELNTSRIKTYSFKNLRLLGIWTFLLFTGRSGHLWYLGALVLSVVLISFLIKKGIKLQFIFIISIMLFAIGLLGDSYYGFIEPLKNYFIPKLFIVAYDNIFSTTRNGVFFGFIFVFIGVIFAHKRIVINRFISIVGLIVSVGLLFVEVYLLNCFSNPKDYNMYVSLVPVSFFMFYIASHINIKSRDLFISMRIIGMLVFFTHLFVDYFVVIILKIMNNKMGIDIMKYNFIISVLFTVLLSIVIERLSRTNKFYWLKYLYS